MIHNENDDFLDFVDDFDQSYPEDSYSDYDDEDDDSFSSNLLDEDYDDDELERRRVAYAGLKKNDKIFNNTYNMGLDTSDEDEGSDSSTTRSAGPEIKLDSSAPGYHLYYPEKYAEHVDRQIIRKDIDQFIKNSPSVQEILGNDPEKKKFTKPEINSLFELINTGLSRGGATNVFVSPIHVLDSISSTVSMEYKKIFDMLTYENKEILLLELNSKYGFLDNVSKNYKMF